MGMPPISFLALLACSLSTLKHVLLGSCFKTGGIGSPMAITNAHDAAMARLDGTSIVIGHDDDFSMSVISLIGRCDGEMVRLLRKRCNKPSFGVLHPTKAHHPLTICFPPDNFKHSLTLFSNSFSSFPHGACSLPVSRNYLALDRIYHPIWAAFPNNPTH
ncbi:hypothetical protein HPP92_006523 [Vanilla planifolia]|uniref:Uncharacterized protein n=1 Tax=Vanilla planifolia TaxID=51239 RepID=A0A835RRN4_VANPL|nr:hypothetical protein HPP92_006523 [Vanilla planifolia]